MAELPIPAGTALAVKTPLMAAKITLRDGETLDHALQRFRKAVNQAYRRQFYKTRIGCYEKPSDRNRRRRRAGQRREQIRQQSGSHLSLDVCIHLRGLHSRGENPFRS